MKDGDIMREEVSIQDNKYKFKFRVSGLIKHDDKILFVEMDDSGFWCLPGGHVELGENTEEAMIREINEEVLLDTKIAKYLGIVENFFVNKRNFNIHEICFYYLLEPKDKKYNIKDFTRIENDKGTDVKLNFKWFSINDIEKVNIKPFFLKELLKKDNLEFKHLITKD